MRLAYTILINYKILYIFSQNRNEENKSCESKESKAQPIKDTTPAVQESLTQTTPQFEENIFSEFPQGAITELINELQKDGGEVNAPDNIPQQDLDLLFDDMQEEEDLAEELNKIEETLSCASSNTEHTQLQHSKINIMTAWVYSTLEKNEQNLYADALAIFNSTPRYENNARENFLLPANIHKLQSTWEQLVCHTGTKALSPFIITSPECLKTASSGAEEASCHNPEAEEEKNQELEKKDVQKTFLQLLRLH